MVLHIVQRVWRLFKEKPTFDKSKSIWQLNEATFDRGIIEIALFLLKISSLDHCISTTETQCIIQEWRVFELDEISNNFCNRSISLGDYWTLRQSDHYYMNHCSEQERIIL